MHMLAPFTALKVIILDLSPEMNSKHFRSLEKRTIIHLTKRAIENFLHNKHSINAKHEFALMVFRERAEWLVDFQSKPDDLITQLNHYFPIDSTPAEIDLSVIFDCLHSKIKLPKAAGADVAPAYIVRAIMVYGRSHSVPTLEKPCASYDSLLSSPYFFLDILYVHEIPSDDNVCTDVYTALCQLDETEKAYVLEVSTSMTRLLENVTILLAHALQRPPQADANYALTS
eukprot:scpid81650/ scgid1133/ BRISC and BRCA1-A complex member 1; Mediator of RAP80 interactions and targeting subunit of 40 kDa; New component of the BRCA1-A complex